MTIPTTPSTFPSQLNTSAMAGVNYSNFTLLASKLLLFPASLVSITHVISPVVFITLLRTKDKKKARSPVVLWGWAAGGGGWVFLREQRPGVNSWRDAVLTWRPCITMAIQCLGQSINYIREAHIMRGP